MPILRVNALTFRVCQFLYVDWLSLIDRLSAICADMNKICKFTVGFHVSTECSVKYQLRERAIRIMHLMRLQKYSDFRLNTSSNKGGVQILGMMRR